MSTIPKQQNWDKSSETLNSKYEKCRHITEEIYKRINITFQIKKLEADTLSECSNISDHIDSNDLSNETDLFACDKSSISSSTELEALERGSEACEKFINNNNNNEESKVKTTAVYKRPRKRFRKRVKKQRNKRDSDGSSDEELPNVGDLDALGRSSEYKASPSPAHTVMGVPYVVIKPCDLKLKIKSLTPDKKIIKKSDVKQIKKPKVVGKTTDKRAKTDVKQKADNLNVSMVNKGSDPWSCTMCSLKFRGERGLRRHMTMSHLVEPEPPKKSNKTVQ